MLGIVIAYIVICILISIIKTKTHNSEEKNTYPMRMKQNESISRPQQVLYDAIQDCKQQTARLTDGINSMNDNLIENNRYSAISAYNSRQSVILQQRQNDILYYRY